uniref:Uncharacterized protein n=1 Tax=Timema bartmani TaxID=61472 RepID=A0A7R9ERQ2_9NEOP|nr:unnamed protein product [Timema bartmani]
MGAEEVRFERCTVWNDVGEMLPNAHLGGGTPGLGSCPGLTGQSLEHASPTRWRMDRLASNRARLVVIPPRGQSVHPTEIRTSISPSSAVELNTTSALAYATEAGI